MIKLFSFLLLLGIVAEAAEQKNDPVAVPPILQEFLPKETREKLDELTSDQHEVLQASFKKHGPNAAALSLDLSANHPELAKNVGKVMREFERRVQSLPEAGRAFVGKVIGTLQNVASEADLRKAAADLVRQWSELNAAAAKAVSEQFPTVPKVLENEKFKEFANKRD
ncbi:Fatty-acid and retinol-binding protein 4 [Aphelenchoides fujianensis]|nr:Fatty-acid and retinol-binding protein 4 [Aphelenchoides fujianensis]